MEAIDDFSFEPIDYPLETYEANWDTSILTLDKKELDTADKVFNYVRDFLFFVPKQVFKPLVNFFIIPKSSKFFFPSGILLASEFLKEMNRCFVHTWKMKELPLTFFDINSWLNRLSQKPEVLQSYNALELKLKTPDGIELEGHFFKHINADHPNSRIMLVFGGNGEFYKTGITLTWLMKDLYNMENLPISFLTVNLRGCDGSGGTPSRDGLIIDAESLYQYALTQVGNDESKIDIFGHSLGGTIGLQLKALHPESNSLTFISRTFKNLQEESSYYAKKEIGEGFWAQVAHNLIKNMSLLLGWQYDNAKILPKIKDRTFVFYHKGDQTIPYEVSLAKEVFDQKLDQKNFEVLEVKDTDRSFANRVTIPHLSTLDTLEVVNRPGKNGLDIILDAYGNLPKKDLSDEGFIEGS